MKCFNHKDTEAVAVCVHCGMALCNACAVRSGSGRLVCSDTCSTSSGRIEEFISSTRNKSVRGARISAYLMFGSGIIFVLSAAFFGVFYHDWFLTSFVGLFGVVLAISNIGYMQVAKRNTASGAD